MTDDRGQRTEEKAVEDTVHPSSVVCPLSSGLLIREATAEDVGAIYDFLCRVAPPTGCVHGRLDCAKARREIARVVAERGYGYALLALVEGELAGTIGVVYVDWWYGADKFFAERWFFVDPDPRNRSRGPRRASAAGCPVGKALLWEADAIAQNVGAPLIVDGMQRRRQNSAVVFTRQRMLDADPANGE